MKKSAIMAKRLVLLATSLGLNTCWVAMTFKKGAVRKQCTLAKGEKTRCRNRTWLRHASGTGASQQAP